MSYILDALKKSEKERMRKSAPDILSVQETILHEKKKNNIWRYLIIVALFANIFIFGYWLFYSGYNGISLRKNYLDNTKTNNIYSQKVEPPSASNNNKADTTKQIAPDNLSFSIANKKSNIIDKSITTQSNESKHKLENTRIQSLKNEKKETQKIPDKENLSNHEKSIVRHSLPVNKEPIMDTNKLYSINELPSPLKESLPPINMTIFMYSDDPASRMVRINGQTLREGQNISEDVKLEEIRADGIIISYKNYKMHIGQKQ